MLARLELIRLSDRILAAASALSPEELRTLDVIHVNRTTGADGRGPCSCFEDGNDGTPTRDLRRDGAMTGASAWRVILLSEGMADRQSDLAATVDYRIEVLRAAPVGMAQAEFIRDPFFETQFPFRV